MSALLRNFGTAFVTSAPIFLGLACAGILILYTGRAQGLSQMPGLALVLAAPLVFLIAILRRLVLENTRNSCDN